MSPDGLQAYKVRPSSTSEDVSFNAQLSTSAPDTSSTITSQHPPHRPVQTHPSTPIQTGSATMCGPIIDLSPLSSPASLPETPPRAWDSVKASHYAEELGPAPCNNNVPNGTHDSAVPTSTRPAGTIAINEDKVPAAGASPDSSKSDISNASKKRSRSDVNNEPAPVAKKRAKQPLPPSTRPSRTRKAPQRLGNQPELPMKKPTPLRKATGKPFDPSHITTHANSRLKKTDVYHMLLKNEPWTCLTVEQKQTAFSLLPTTPTNRRLLGEIVAGTAAATTRPKEFSQNFNLFRTDVAKFKEDLVNGYFGKRWQEQAEQAVIARAEGDFDDWKEKEAQLWWGQN